MSFIYKLFTCENRIKHIIIPHQGCKKIRFILFKKKILIEIDIFDFIENMDFCNKTHDFY